MSDLIKVNGVRGRLDKNGNPELNLEDVARGLGFTQVANSGNEVVRWERVDKYLEECGVPTRGDGGYIPENIVYKLCFKAKNKTAQEFQNRVTDEVLPSIRKHGAYLTPAKIEEVLLNPDTIIQLATQLKSEREQNQMLSVELERKDQLIGELKPKADYVDFILSSAGTVTTTQIAADYCMSAQELNKVLCEEKIQRKVDGQWILYKDHMGLGYTKSETIDIVRSNGRPDVKMHTKWTQKGRLLINEVLNKRGVYANMDLIAV